EVLVDARAAPRLDADGVAVARLAEHREREPGRPALLPREARVDAHAARVHAARRAVAGEPIHHEVAELVEDDGLVVLVGVADRRLPRLAAHQLERVAARALRAASRGRRRSATPTSTT